MLTYWKAEGPQNKQLSIWNYQSIHPQELWTIKTWNKYWKQQQMNSVKDFWRWYNNKDVVLTLKAMQKLFAFYHEKEIDMLKLGCTLPHMANICLNKTTDAKVYLFTEADKVLLEKFWEDVDGGPSIIFTPKAFLDETFVQKATNKCISIVGIDAIQLYP